MREIGVEKRHGRPAADRSRADDSALGGNASYAPGPASEQRAITPSAREPGDVDRNPQRVAVLLIDFINTMDLEGAEPLRTSATAAADPVLRLRDEADALEAPVVYVNDNYGLWNSERATIVEHRSKEDGPTRESIGRIGRAATTSSSSSRRFPASTRPACRCSCRTRRVTARGDRRRCRYLRAVHGGRCAHARLRPLDPVGRGRQRRERAHRLNARHHAKRMGAETRPTSELSIEEWVGGLVEKSLESVAGNS